MEVPSARKSEVHERLLRAYSSLRAKDQRRAFRKRLQRATGKSPSSVSRWLGDRIERAGPPGPVLDAVERFLEDEK